MRLCVQEASPNLLKLCLSFFFGGGGGGGRGASLEKSVEG